MVDGDHLLVDGGDGDMAMAMAMAMVMVDGQCVVVRSEEVVLVCYYVENLSVFLSFIQKWRETCTAIAIAIARFGARVLGAR
jgi:hypothetical protein